ncbi:hypothetical protein [Prosthecobacter sp.]|uniref:hypothetical protein n=1 Tax=Prosthecobacter sp. TaxID=1965333 RepID=UPI003784EAD5
MRTPALFLALSLSITAALAGGYAPADFPSYAALPPQAKPWFQHLAAAQDIPGDVFSLAKVPQAEPATVELMQKIVSDPAGSPQHLLLVIQCIHARRDLSAAHQVWLRELFLSRLSRTNGPVDEVLKTDGLLLLEDFPSPENEAVLDQYLTDTSAPFAANDGHAAYYAMRALSRTGTLQSIRPLLKYAESHRPERGEGHHYDLEAMQAIRAIEYRAAPMSPALRTALENCFPCCIPDDKAMARAEKALATRPEFKPQLFALLKVQYFEIPQWGGWGSTNALSALALRSDLTPVERKLITTELETHLAQADESPFINPAIRLLAHYPSPEHEALVLRFLNRDAKQQPILRAAFHTLSIIGGEKSLAAMREVQADLKAQHAESFLLNDLEQDITRMQQWIERRTPPAKRR